MICVSLGDISFEQCLKALKQFPFVEIRIDLMHLSIEQLREIFSFDTKLIATCRTGGRYSVPECERFLKEAVIAGADYIDLELESDEEYKNKLFRIALEHNCKKIISFHDFNGTPDRKRLLAIVDQCFNSAADISKIACMANSKSDAARLLGLLDDNRDLVVLGMGEFGKSTRIAAQSLGSKISYAAFEKSPATADGQIEYFKMLKIIKELESV